MVMTIDRLTGFWTRATFMAFQLLYPVREMRDGVAMDAAVVTSGAIRQLDCFHLHNPADF
jgi:hypothetical protein